MALLKKDCWLKKCSFYESVISTSLKAWQSPVAETKGFRYQQNPSTVGWNREMYFPRGSQLVRWRRRTLAIKVSKLKLWTKLIIILEILSYLRKLELTKARLEVSWLVLFLQFRNRGGGGGRCESDTWQRQLAREHLYAHYARHRRRRWRRRRRRRWRQRRRRPRT